MRDKEWHLDAVEYAIEVHFFRDLHEFLDVLAAPHPTQEALGVLRQPI
jgi:hypothetical protein